MYSYKDLLELAGLTTRLYTLLSTLHSLPALPAFEHSTDGALELKNVDVGIPIVKQLEAGPGKEILPLVRDLTLKLQEGEHLMITGSNGVGKTAVARVLAGLWAPQGSEGPQVKRPAPDAEGRPTVCVVPQRAYMVAGSLLDQMIYPHSYAEFLESGKTEEDLMEILEMVYLAYLPEREGGWTTRKEWRDILSGGEKQRMSLARVFYHHPRFAILDGK